jgi:hypothetical protein
VGEPAEHARHFYLRRNMEFAEGVTFFTSEQL